MYKKVCEHVTNIIVIKSYTVMKIRICQNFVLYADFLGGEIGGFAQLPNRLIRQINPNVSSESGTMYNKKQTALSHSHIYHHIKLI